MKTLNIKSLETFILAGAMLAVAVVAAMALFAATAPMQAHANPFYVGTKAKTALATTSVTYLTTTVATTTFVYDSYEQNGTNQTNGGNITLPDSVALLLQGNASSTNTVLSITCEYGDDEVNQTTGVTAIDWYQNAAVNGTTTNTGVQSIGTPNSYSYTYASTTVGGAGVLSNTSRFEKAVICPVPTRYVRAVIGVSGANAGVWGAFIPKKQRN